MRRLHLFLAVAGIVASRAAAETPEECAELVQSAFRAGDGKALADLAARRDPDPWLVADELSARGAHDAADAFAIAARRTGTEGLAEYVRARRASPTPPELRAALEPVRKALQSHDPEGGLAAIGELPIGGGDIASLRLRLARGVALQGLHRVDESDEAFRSVIEGAEGVGWIACAAFARHSMALNLWMRGDLPGAVAVLDAAAKTYELLGDTARLAATLRRRGGVHIDLGEYAAAQECQERALKLSEADGDAWGSGVSLGELGVIHRRLGAYAKALEYQERALAIATNRMDRALALSNIAVIYGDLGDHARSLEYLERAVELQEAIGVPGLSITNLGSMALLHVRLGSREKAQDVTERMLRIADRIDDAQDVAQAFNVAGTVHAMLGSYAKALEYLERARKLRETWGDRVGLEDTLSTMAGVHATLGELDEAEALYRRALELSRETGDAWRKVCATSLARLLAERLGRTAEALPLFEEAIALVEMQREGGRGLSEREQAMLSNVLSSGGAFEGMARAQLQLGRPAEALGYLERGRARGVLDLLERSRFDPFAEAERRAREQGDEERLGEIVQVAAGLRAADREVARLTRLFEARRAATDAPRDEILAADQARRAALEVRGAAQARRARLVRDLLPTGAPATPAALQLGLGPRERMFFYAFDSAGGLLLVVPPHGREIRGYALTWEDGSPVDEKSLAAAVEAFVRGVGAGGPGRGLDPPVSDAKPADRGLFRALVPAAVRDEIAGFDLIYIVPHGPLHRLPFEALDVGGGKTWLEAEPPVVYGPSGSVLQWCRKRRDQQRGASPRHEVVALGDAAFPSLPPLPGSRREVESIRAAVGADRSVLLLGKEATVAKLFALAPQARYLHLATHLIADEREYFGQSRLLLTPEGDDGAVSLHDLLEHWRDRLSSCELVVLSACDAHLGPLQRDEGPYAMPLGFLYAGTAAVIGSLWRVDDQSTADLFADYYKRLGEGKGKLRAFTDARRALMRKYPQPYHWAAFVYVGDPR